MADNVLKATISVEAPNVVQTTQKVIASADKVATSLKKVAPASNVATQSLINLGRVAQDAPFGIIGIANNINPLLESFQRLRASSTSTGAALKTLAGSLIGGGGLGLAVSVVTGLMSYFALSSQGAKKETEELNTASKEAAKKQEEFSTAVSSAAQSVISQTKDIANLRDIMLSTKRATDDLTQSTINQGIARLLFDSKSKAIQESLNAEIEREFILRKRTKGLGVQGVAEFKEDPEVKQLQDLSKALKNLGGSSTADLDKDIKRIQELNGVIGSSGGVVRSLNSMSEGLQGFFKGFVDGKSKSDDASNQIISKAKEFAAFFDKFTIRQFDFDIDPRDTLAQSVEKAKAFIAKTFGPRNAFAFKINALAKIDVDSPELFKNLPAETETIAKRAEKLIAELTKRNPILIQFQAKIDNDKKLEREALARSQELANNVTQAVGGAFQGLGEAIGNIIGGADIGSQIFGVIGDLISNIGKALIKFGIVQTIVEKLLKNPFSIGAGKAIALGIGAIALGQLVKNIASKGQRAVGGPVNAGDAYLVGERGPEYFVPNAGGKIIPNNAIAGARGTQMPMQISGLFRVQGNDLVAAIANTNRSQGRLN